MKEHDQQPYALVLEAYEQLLVSKCEQICNDALTNAFIQKDYQPIVDRLDSMIDVLEQTVEFLFSKYNEKAES